MLGGHPLSASCDRTSHLSLYVVLNPRESCQVHGEERKLHRGRTVLSKLASQKTFSRLAVTILVGSESKRQTSPTSRLRFILLLPSKDLPSCLPHHPPWCFKSMVKMPCHVWQIKSQIECQIKCQIECQIKRQNKSDRMPEICKIRMREFVSLGGDRSKESNSSIKKWVFPVQELGLRIKNWVTRYDASTDWPSNTRIERLRDWSNKIGLVAKLF